MRACPAGNGKGACALCIASVSNTRLLKELNVTKIILISPLVLAISVGNVSAQVSSNTSSDADVEIMRERMVEALRPVCADRKADLRAKRTPKRFNAFLLRIPASARAEVILTCKSM